MADVPDSVGYFTVEARALRAFADSNDAGDRPDARAPIAKVTFVPEVPGKVLLAVEEKVIIIMETVHALLDTEGHLVAPSDGQGSASSLPGGGTNDRTLELVAPNQASLSKVGWTWTAKFWPLDGQGQTWQAFSVSGITAVPGETVNLGDEVFKDSISSLTQQPVVWSLLSSELSDADDIPTVLPEARSGQFVYFTDTGALFLIGDL